MSHFVNILIGWNRKFESNQNLYFDPKVRSLKININTTSCINVKKNLEMQHILHPGSILIYNLYQSEDKELS